MEIRRVCRAIGLAGAVSLVAASAVHANDANISTGDAKKDGIVEVAIVMTGPGGAKETVTWKASIAKGDTAQEKAQKIRDAAPPPGNVTIGGAGNVVRGSSGAGWTITGMGFKNDGTKELSVNNVFAANLSDHRGLASLSGFAEGRDPDGNGGYVSVFTGDAGAFIETFPGMPAEEIEHQIIQQLQDQGMPVRWVTPDDLLAENFPGLEGDGRMAYLEQIGPEGLWIDVKDDGLILDVGALIDVSGGYSEECLRLDVKNLVAGGRAEFLLTGGEQGSRAVTVYGLQAGRTNVNDVSGYCATFGIKGVSQSRVLGGLNRAFDAGGIIAFGVAIPGNVRGTDVLFQSALRGTCPDECVSNLVEMTIQ